jgi:3-phenylpropionate/trans-cinnamate dioxygenase ferredoxin reductase subunit
MPPTESTDVLLIGGGVASVRCARTLRREGFDGRIVLVGDEPTLPYNRPPLSKEFLRDDLPDDLVLAEPERWYERRGVELWTGHRLATLDAQDRTAELDDGTIIRFDQALLATGARPRRPPIPGADHALLLRTLADARAIRARAVDGGVAVVIGGGLIGVEVASGLAALGMRVSVIEVADRLWGGGFGEELGQWARERLEGIGVAVRLATAVDAVLPDGVRFADELVPADLVVAGVGVIPNDELATTAGIVTGDGILADERHATSAPGVFAAGDVARIDGRRIEHWHAAREGGERAALAMLGRPLPPAPTPWVFSEVTGIPVDVVGWAPAWDEVVDLGGATPTFGYVTGGAVMQVALVDRSDRVDELRAVLPHGPSIAELRTIV